MSATVAVELCREDVIQMFLEMGNAGADAWKDSKIQKRLAALPEYLSQEDAKEPVSKRGLTTLDKILAALDDGQEIALVARNEDDSDEEGTSEEETSEEETSEEETDTTDDDPAPKKKGRRKKKAVEEEAEEEAEEKETFNVPLTYKFREIEKPKIVKSSPALAKRFRDMERFPRDRELQSNRLEHLRAEIKAGTFRGAEWVSCLCKEDDTVYRINGKHTSHLLAELYDAGEKLEFPMLVREYEADTLEDAAYLFATYDPKWSARSKNDLLKVFSSTHKQTQDLPPRMLTVLTSGVAFAHMEQKYRKLGIEQQAKLLLQHDKFAAWASGLLEETKVSKHLMRMSVLAAMFRTWSVDPEAAEEFWTKIRDDSDDPKDAPTRVLYRWLLSHKVGAREAKERVGEREVYFYCLKAWNAWRNEETTVKLTHYKTDSKTPEVI